MDARLLDPNDRAYGRKEGSFDPVLALVGPGTPGGELLRRYWQPVAEASECVSRPTLIRRFGEDLILFRNGRGEPGLLHPNCVHRGASLLYGKVEEDGIRCCYHGWKFDTQGHCLDQPCEPDGGRNKQRYRQPWYPVVEALGCIWTYMGPPEKQPLFPIFSCFENMDEDEFIRAEWFGKDEVLSPFPMDHNWFQTWDNATDHFHVTILHARHSGAQFPDDRLNEDLPDEINWAYSEDKRSILTTIKRVDKKTGDTWMRVEQGLMPNMLSLPSFFADGPGNWVQVQVPFDDTHFATLTISRQSPENPYLFPSQIPDIGYGSEKKKWRDMDPEYHQRFPMDYEAQHSQGLITLHSEEHLAYSDTGLGMHRRMFKQAAETVAKGGDPIGVAFREEDRRVNVSARSWTIAANQDESVLESI